MPIPTPYLHSSLHKMKAIAGTTTMALADEERGYNGKITCIVILSCMVAATGGIIYGYDIGISGMN